MTAETTESQPWTGGLAAALAAVQAELPHIAKDKTAHVRSDRGSYSYRYADLADVTSAVMPLLARHGLAWTSAPTLRDGQFMLRYDLLHSSGEHVGGWYPLPDPDRGTPQAIGSAITYARRYALCAVTGVAADADDDAQAAQAEHQPAHRRPTEPARRAPARREPEPEPAVDQARAAAQMLDQVLSVGSREAAVALWKVTRGSSHADTDVSGLLDEPARAALGVAAGEPVTLQQAAARAGAYVKTHGRPIRVRAEDDAPAEAEQEETDDPAGAEG